MTREELSWVLYDVGNSAFVLVMVTAIMPIFFKDFAAGTMSGVDSTATWGFANSAASLILAFLAPILGAMADYKDRKKQFFVFFLFLSLLFTVLLVFVGRGQWLLCLFLFVIARVGWAGANIFYDAFLPDVAIKERVDIISTRGYGYGYIGSVLPFIIVIGILLSKGVENGLSPEASKIGFLIVAVWWLLFSLPAIKNLRQKHYLSVEPAPLRRSFLRLWRTFNEIRRYKQAFLFLLAYFFYIDGVDTIISMSTAYGRDLGFSVPLLIVVLLVIQVVAFPFSLLFGRLAEISSTRRMIFVGIGVYCLITLVAFFLPTFNDTFVKTLAFWLIAVLVASSMGGIQALSRSYFCRFIPAEKSAELFGLYNVCGKFAAIAGPLLMAVVGKVSGETRWGVLSLLVLFVVGAFLLSRVEE